MQHLAKASTDKDIFIKVNYHVESSKGLFHLISTEKECYNRGTLLDSSGKSQGHLIALSSRSLSTLPVKYLVNAKVARKG